MAGWDELQPPAATTPPASAPAAPGAAPRSAAATPSSAARQDEAPEVPALPSPSLPKGGGAVRGIGETYAVNSATGTLTLTVPIAVSKARDLEPQLSLRYDSGAGNGHAGEGWSLTIASVDRRTDRMLPRYRDDDVFIAGGEDLVPSLQPNSGAWVNGARDARTHLVQCFRPRVESSYDRVERWTRKAGGDVHWRVRTAAGMTHVYGEDPAARVTDPDDPRRVHRWLCERSYDARGNLVSYRYRAEDRAGVPAAVWEENRRPVDTLIDRILYGVRRPYDPSQPAPADPAAYLFEVVFDYGERDGVADGTAPPYAPPAAWAVRQDPFSNYKPGFEVRCYRLCKRILVFHRIDELGPDPVLVRETRLRYLDDPSLSKLAGVTSIGWRDGAALAHPELRFDYTEARVDPTVHELDAAAVEDLPPPVDGSRSRWVDLDGEGIPGALVVDTPGWYYKRNLGGGALAAAEPMRVRPAQDLLGGGQLLDVGGDGVKALVHFGGATPGLHARTEDFGWADFQPFRSLPAIEFDDPNLRFVDLDGDGRADLLITEDRVLRWYPSLGDAGFDEALATGKPYDERRGPALVFADGEQAVYLADMTGDGLTDLVRVRNGQVCYWPNLGYGRFGARITMGRAPHLSSAADFNQANVRLADVDGSGTADLLYCESDRVRYWRNLAGNAFSDEAAVAGPGPYDSTVRVEAVDLLGDGTSCLVWSSPLPQQARAPVRWVSLTGGVKPHLLRSVDNGMGRRATFDFAPSTRFYLADRAAGRPWVTRIPFPVQVLERVTAVDQVGGSRLASEYAYHHGFYDGVEREFRGFGMVEQRDTQSLAALQSQGRFPADVDDVPPARTLTWFHTGAFLEEDELVARFRTEWFGLDPGQQHPADAAMPGGLDAGEWREALRAMRGKPLRVEIYAEEQPPTPATAIPYQVEEYTYQLRTLQPRGSRRHAVFACDAVEKLTYAYERDAADPRVEHDVVLRVGAYGAVEQRVRIGYPRRPTQSGTLIAYSEQDHAARGDEAELYRVNVVAQTRRYEVTGLVPPVAGIFSVAQLQAIPALAGGGDDLAYDQAPNPTRLQRRLVAHTLLRYYADDDTTPLAPGSFGARALLYRAEHALMPATMVAAVFPAAVDAAMLGAAGYVQHDGHWWSVSDGIGYSAAAFFQATGYTDAFGNASQVVYDAHQLVPAQVVNALGQAVAVTTDYHGILPTAVTDVNGNTSLAAYDALGRVRDIALTGKSGEGDTLAAPTIHYDYAVDDWRTLSTPNHTYTRQRLVHGQPGFAETYVYSDGFERELMTKVRADPGPAQVVQGGVVVTVVSADRWIASGRTVFDNKGNPVRKYEPFYADGSGYEADPLLAQLGVSSVLHYDPLSRVVRVDMPDGSFSRTEIAAWTRREWDGDDTVDDGAQLWANRPGQTPADQRATAAARSHRRTPLRSLADALGRKVSSFADNTTQPPGSDVPEASHVLYESRRVLDVAGRLLGLYTDRGLHALPPYATLTQTWDMCGRVVRSTSAEAGTATLLPDVRGLPVHSRDARGIELLHAYDVLRRPTTVTATDTAAATAWVAERTVYGDDPAIGPVPAAANLLGRVYEVYDQAGIHTQARYDFKGNLLEERRQLISTLEGAPDWTATYLTPFVTVREFDALDRVVRTVLPRRNTVAGSDNVLLRTYLPQGRLQRITLTTQYGGGAVDVLSAVEYDARGRRVSATYGNGVVRTYTYDPLSFRLSGARSVRGGGDVLQDIAYTYDAAGNLTEVSDAAQPTVFTRNQMIAPRLAYTYDSIYRLTDAGGRELHDPAQPDDVDLPFGTWPPDGNDLAGYTEHYDYDSDGNILRMTHHAGMQGWVRGYGYDARSNRLLGTSLPGAPDPTVLGAAYAHDAAGNVVAMPHLPAIAWDERGRLAGADRGGGGAVHNRHDRDGQRVRKVQTRSAGGGTALSHERIYAGEYEVYREFGGGGAVSLEREAVHAVDDTGRIIVVETDTSAAAPAPVSRYQLDNHLGSAIVELDSAAALLSYEEYHPFGTTAYRARAAIAEVSLKRYRFLARERDEETGFAYCGARHYCEWLGRWFNPDPKGVEGGVNLYAYCGDNPIGHRDPGGRDPNDSVTAPTTVTLPPVPQYRLTPPSLIASSVAQSTGPPPATNQPSSPSAATPDAQTGQAAQAAASGQASENPDYANAIYASVTQSLMGPKAGHSHGEFNLQPILILPSAGSVGGGLNTWQGSVRFGLGHGLDLGGVSGISAGATPGAGGFGSGGNLGLTFHGGWKAANNWGGAFWLAPTVAFGGTPSTNVGGSLTGVVGYERDPSETHGAWSFDASPSVAVAQGGQLYSGANLTAPVTFGGAASATYNRAGQGSAWLFEAYGYGVSGGAGAPGGPTGAGRVGAGFGYTSNWIQDPGTPRAQANSAAVNVNYFFESTTGGTGPAVNTHVLQLTLTLAVGR